MLTELKTYVNGQIGTVTPSALPHNRINSDAGYFSIKGNILYHQKQHFFFASKHFLF